MINTENRTTLSFKFITLIDRRLLIQATDLNHVSVSNSNLVFVRRLRFNLTCSEQEVITDFNIRITVQRNKKLTDALSAVTSRVSQFHLWKQVQSMKIKIYTTTTCTSAASRHTRVWRKSAFNELERQKLFFDSKFLFFFFFFLCLSFKRKPTC